MTAHNVKIRLNSNILNDMFNSMRIKQKIEEITSHFLLPYDVRKFDNLECNCKLIEIKSKFK